MSKSSSRSKKVVKALKYNLEKQIGLMPKKITVGRIVAHLDKYGISKSQFYRDKKIALDSPQSITHDRLTIYAKVLSCDIGYLVNESPSLKNIKSITDMLK